MTLQGQQVHLAYSEIARGSGTVGRVTTAAALSFHWYMLINERALLIGMALDATRVPGRHRPHLPERRGAVDVVAIAALDETFVYSMVKRLREVGLGGRMASVAKFGL